MIDKAIFSLPGIKKALFALGLFCVVQALLIISQAWSLSYIITNLWYGQALASQWVWLGIFLLSFIGRQICVYFQDLFLDNYAYQQAGNLRHDLLSMIFSSGAEIVQPHGTGKITTSVLEGIDQVETYFRLIFPKIVGLVIIPPLLLISVVFLDWISGIVLLIIFPFVILYMILMGHTAKERATKQHETYQVLSNHFIDSLRGIDTLKYFGLSGDHGASIYTISERFRKATIKTLRAAMASGLVLDLFSTLSLAAVSVLLGLRLLDGSLLLFPALTILVLSPEYFKPIREFASDYHASLEGKNALNLVLELIETPIESVNTQAIASWKNDSMLAINELDYSYPEAEVLHNIAFEAKGFKKIGIVGVSGAGKSTLIDVLGGFSTPNQGHILINDTPLSSFKQHEWQKQVVYIPQDPYIFHATLKENIAFYYPSASDEEIREAIEVVGLQELISELPQGIDTKIGEGARTLSGGQSQRIALARAFLDRSRKIFLFDEPTAHLDIETEIELKERMLPLMQDHLVFFATHRLHWMHDMDTILVLENGRIVESGTLEELIVRKGKFAELVSAEEGVT